jgi:hypothetical protein
MTQPGDVVAVDPASLINHASHLDGIASDIGVVTDAAMYVRMDVGAYGQVCAFVPSLLSNLSNPLSQGLDAVTRSLRDTANRLRLAAAEYSAADDRGTQRTQVPP